MGFDYSACILYAAQCVTPLAYTRARTHTRTHLRHTLLPPSPSSHPFSASAPCETPLINSYYSSLMSTPCIQIPMLSNWKCMSLNPSQFPPVAGTQALVIIIILGVLGGYIYHMKTFGGHGLPLHLLFANAKQ